MFYILSAVTDTNESFGAEPDFIWGLVKSFWNGTPSDVKGPAKAIAITFICIAVITWRTKGLKTVATVMFSRWFLYPMMALVLAFVMASLLSSVPDVHLEHSP